MQHTSMVTNGVEIDFQRWPDQHPAINSIDMRRAVHDSLCKSNGRGRKSHSFVHTGTKHTLSVLIVLTLM